MKRSTCGVEGSNQPDEARNQPDEGSTCGAEGSNQPEKARNQPGEAAHVKLDVGRVRRDRHVVTLGAADERATFNPLLQPGLI